jgi:hypothetical protein
MNSAPENRPQHLIKLCLRTVGSKVNLCGGYLWGGGDQAPNRPQALVWYYVGVGSQEQL